MGFFSSEKLNTAEIPVAMEMRIDDVEVLLRIAESDESADTVITNFLKQVRTLKAEAETAGGMRPEDWTIVQQDAQLASESMKALGYDVDPALFDSLD